MKRYHLLSRLFCGLSLLSLSGIAAQAKQAPLDASPGWAIILADDYKGESGPLYGVAERDAINWYRLLVTKMKFQPDHIILLAEGGADFAKFLATKTLTPKTGQQTPFTEAPVWADFEKNKATNRVSKQMDWLIAQQPESEDDIGAFRELFKIPVHIPDTNTIPYCAAPTAHNFRVVRNIISGLAKAPQMVAVIVLAHAGTDPNVVMTKPVEAAPANGAGAGPENWLTADDFTLKGCKAGRRMLVMDHSLRAFDEDIAPAKDHKFGDDVKKAFAGDSSLILLASDGSGISLPLKFPGGSSGKPTKVGSAFFNAVTGVLESQEEYDLQSGQAAIKTAFNFGMSNVKKYLVAKPEGPFRPAPLISAGMTEALMKDTKMVALIAPSTNSKPENPGRQVKLVGNDQIAYESRVLRISQVPVGEYPEKREKIIANRFSSVLRSRLTEGGLREIKVGQRNGKTVVLMPVLANGKRLRVKDSPNDKETIDFLVTVDDELVHLMGKPEILLADTLARDIRIALNKSSYGMLADDPTPDMQLIKGRDLFKQGHYAEAITELKDLLQSEPNRGVAYVWLGRSLIALNQMDEAREMFADLSAYHKDHPEDLFDTPTEADLNTLATQINAPWER